jgi:translation initiation factor 5
MTGEIATQNMLLCDSLANGSCGFTDPTKFFGFELGAQTTTDQKNDRWIVNGKHDQSTLENLLESFIAKFLLCGTCRNPETTMTVLQSGNIDMRCKACGNTTRADPVHKLCTFIQKNPPPISAKEAKLAAKVNAAKAQAEAVGTEGDTSLPVETADGSYLSASDILQPVAGEDEEQTQW